MARPFYEQFAPGDRVTYVSDPERSTKEDLMYEGKHGIVESLIYPWIFVLFDDESLNQSVYGRVATGFYASQLELVNV